MIDQVLISKRLFSIGVSYSEQADSLSAGLAISLFQDSVEQLVWCIVKHASLGVKDTEAFTSLLDKVENITPDPLPYKAKILELNKARTGFKHYGNLPATSESIKFRSYTQDFIRVACQRYLDLDFDNVSLASLISNEKVRHHVKYAEERLSQNNPIEALSEVALARFLLFKELNKFLPKVDSNLKEVDHLFEQLPGVRGRVQVFRYLTDYLGEMTRFNTAALAGGNIGEHLYFERILPRVLQFADGSTSVSFVQSIEPSKELAENAIKYVVETAIRLSQVT